MFQYPYSPMRKALDLNSQATIFTDPKATIFEPGTNSVSNPFDVGVFEATSAETADFGQIQVLPFCYGEPGSEFWCRVWGWKKILGGGKKVTWLPSLLAEMLCRAGWLDGESLGILGEKEYLADAIMATGGAVSYVHAPSSGGVGWAVVPLMGCEKFQLDFAIGEESPAFPNALWARA